MDKDLRTECINNRYLINLLSDEDKCEVIMDCRTSLIDRIINPSERVQISLLIKNPLDIQYIKNPSEFIQQLAVEGDPFSIKYIKNPAVKVQEHAVYIESQYIRYIENPAAHVKEMAMKNLITNIRYIKNPSEKLQLMAVKKNPAMLKYIKNPTAKVINYCIDTNSKTVSRIINFKHALSIINKLSDKAVEEIFKLPYVIERIEPQDWWKDSVKSLYLYYKL